MEKEELFEKYCSLCGSQICGGIFSSEDEEILKGCPHYLEFLGEQNENKKKKK